MTATLLAVPSTAFAVTVSSQDGNGTQSVSRRANNGAEVTGSLKATDSYKYVYSAGLVDWDPWYCSDSHKGRYTSNTNSTSGTSRGGTIDAASGGCGGSKTKVASKVCRDLAGWADPCGGWSARY